MTPKRIAQLEQMLERGTICKGHIAEMLDAIKQRKPLIEPYDPYNPNPVEYQYHYPDGSWRCSNGEVINGMRPDCARSLYALKDNT